MCWCYCGLGYYRTVWIVLYDGMQHGPKLSDQKTRSCQSEARLEGPIMDKEEFILLVRYYYHEFVALNDTSRHIVDRSRWSDIMWMVYCDKDIQKWLSDLSEDDTGDFLQYGDVLRLSLD